MGFWNSGKKAARFSFISMPLSILGINQLKMGNQHIAALWRSLSNPVCPDCDKGVMVIDDAEGQVIDQQANGQTKHLHPWVCKNCGWGFLEVNDPRKVREGCIRYRNERVKASLTDLEFAEREQFSRGHKLHSRAFFIAASIGIAGFIYMIASGASFMLALNWLSISFALWIFGMKKSYRSWQVRTGNLFVEGSFWFWIKHEKWVI